MVILHISKRRFAGFAAIAAAGAATAVVLAGCFAGKAEPITLSDTQAMTS